MHCHILVIVSLVRLNLLTLNLLIFSGAKFTITAEGTRIIEKDGTSLTLDSSASSSHLAPATRQLHEAVRDVRQYSDTTTIFSC